MSREDFKSFVVTDPNLVDQQLDVSKLATTTPTRKELLGGISTLPGVKYDPTLQSSFTDLLAYFSGGLPRLPQTPTASNVNVPLPGGSGGGGGGITTASTVQPTTTVTGGGVNTPFEQNLINQGAGVQIAPGQPVVAPGEMPVTQAEMDAFNQTPASTTTLPSGDVFATDDPTLQEKIDFTPETKNIFQKAGQTVSGAAEDLKNAGYSVVQQGKDLIANIGGKSIDIGKTIGTGAMNLIGSKVTGVPLLGTAAQMVGKMLPERDPRQTKLDELYPDRNTAGTISSGLMAGYNPVSGGIPGISEPTYGLQDAYDKRIGTIENTLKDKYNMSDAEIADVKAGSYKGDVDTNLLDTLTDLEDAKKKEADVLGITAAEDKRLGEAEMRQTIADAVRQRNLGVGPRETIQPTTTKAQVTGVNPFEGVDTGFEGEFDLPTVNPFVPIEKRKDALNQPSTILDPYNALEGDDVLDLLDDLGYGQDITEDTYTSPYIEDPEAPLNDPFAPVGSGRGGDPRQFMDQPAAANNINISGGLPTYETLPEGASKTGTPIDSLNPINRQQHFDNTEKLKDAVREGKISNETYNRLSAFDARKTMGLGAVTGTLASGAYQGIQSLAGMGQAVADQPIGEAIDDTVRNIQGVSGNITPEEQIQYQEIISGEDIYRDPIMGMVDQPTKGTLAGEPGLPDLMDEFDMTAFDEPIAEPEPSIDMEQRLDDLIRERDLNVGPQFDKPTPMEQRLDDLIRERDLGGGPPSVISRPDPSPPPSFTPRGGGADRDPAPAPAPKSIPDRGRGQIPSRPAPSRPNYGPPSQSGGGGGGGGGCFLKGTPVTMADGSTKAIEKVDLGDNVAKGGKVFATGKFLVENLHDYKGIKVSGSHMVSEDGNWVRVEDSKHGKALGDDEHTVYVFGAENRRILINDILFTDYFEVNEQEKLSEGDKFFDNWKIHAKVDSDNNVNVLNAN